jgi:ABC-type sugar transport system permease subunit
MIIFLAGLQDIPDDVLEAARVDGANSLQSFLFITVPLMRPVILFVVVTFTIGIFRNFGLIFMLTQGGPFNRTNTMVWEVYQNVFGYLRLGRGAAISIVMLVIVLGLTMLSFRVLRERQG